MINSESTSSPVPGVETCSTIEAARLMGVAVRSVQLMVDRGELDAWKTAGGHRRIARASVQRWIAQRQGSLQGTAGAAAPAAAPTGAPVAVAAAVPVAVPAVAPTVAPAAVPVPAVPEAPAVVMAGRRREDPPGLRRPRVLLIEDSAHYQNLMRLLVAQKFPEADLHVADDGIAGLAMAGQLKPQVLIVDILLPGIDGAALITSLRSHPQFEGSRLIVVTSLDEDQRAPYAFALTGVPVVHKPQLVVRLPPLLREALEGGVPAGAVRNTP